MDDTQVSYTSFISISHTSEFPCSHWTQGPTCVCELASTGRGEPSFKCAVTSLGSSC